MWEICFVAKFEQTSHVAMVLQVLPVNKKITAGIWFEKQKQ